ncbi:MAG: type II toxin-antitoxin system VapC family toxin [Verrucomicrobia bacterium]|nr:type II toxin-antitoxin system VapC family toxin [Verrucomicrobiota bacterium]
MIIADASLVSFLFLEGEVSGTVRELYRRDTDWVTPPILNHEMLNILAAVGRADDTALAMEELWKEIRMRLGSRQQIPDPMRALRMAIDLGVSGSEAQYLALSQQLSVPMVSCDQRLLEHLPKLVVSPEVYLLRLE